jgi:hypothetical protein
MEKEVEHLKLRVKELEQKLKSQQRILDKLSTVFEMQEGGILIINSNIGVRGDVKAREIYGGEWFPPSLDGPQPNLPPCSKARYEQELLQMRKDEQKRKEKKEFEKSTMGMLGWLR